MTDWVSEFVSAVGEIANVARQNASWSSSIPSAISVGQLTQTNTGYSISIIVDLSVAPEAAAFEFGSGIHKTRGNPNTYPIYPVNAKALKFPFTVTFPTGKVMGVIIGGKVFGRKATWKMLEANPSGMLSGDFLWSHVDHPGVDANPYLQPAISLSWGNFLNRLNTAMGSLVASSFSASGGIIP